MKTYSFNAHEIGTEVWTTLNGFVQNDIVESVQFVTSEHETNILYKLKSFEKGYFRYGNYVFLTKEEAEASLW